MKNQFIMIFILLFTVALTGLVAVSPVRGSPSNSTTLEVSEELSFADQVSVSLEKQVEITQEFGVADSMLANVNVVGPASLISKIAQQIGEEEFKTLNKVKGIEAFLWHGHPLIKWPHAQLPIASYFNSGWWSSCLIVVLSLLCSFFIIAQKSRMPMPKMTIN